MQSIPQATGPTSMVQDPLVDVRMAVSVALVGIQRGPDKSTLDAHRLAGPTNHSRIYPGPSQPNGKDAVHQKHLCRGSSEV